MGKSIFSNATAQAQKLYRGARDLLSEDGLLTASFDKAVDGYFNKSQEDYVKMLKLMKANKMYSDLDEMTKLKGSMLKKGKENINFGGILVDKDRSTKINKSIANRVAFDAASATRDSTYNQGALRAKGAISFSTAKTMAEKYYVNPLKSGIDSMKTHTFASNKDLHKAIARIGGTAAIGGVATTSMISNDE